jgi:hypothetical protein
MTESRHSFQGQLIGSGRGRKPTDAGVVVVAYHSEATIVDCLDRLLADASVRRIVVVDNASQDATVERAESVARRDARVRVARNRENRGFAAACNEGASALDTPWVAFVNPDCFVAADTLSRLVAHGIACAGAGLLGVEQCDDNGAVDPASRRRDPVLREQCLRLGRRGDWYLGRDPAEVLQIVEAASGALMLMPLGLFLQLGGFDENYLLHFEDLDLCRRVRAAGYEVRVANDLQVLHLRGVSSRQRPLWVHWQKYRSYWRYFEKFDAADTPAPLRFLLRLALWSHFAISLPRASR